MTSMFSYECDANLVMTNRKIASFATPAGRYDAGCHNITNIDFSKVCIKEMMIKNIHQRPQMKWLVMDMTKLTVRLHLSQPVSTPGVSGH